MKLTRTHNGEEQHHAEVYGKYGYLGYFYANNDDLKITMTAGRTAWWRWNRDVVRKLRKLGYKL